MATFMERHAPVVDETIEALAKKRIIEDPISVNPKAARKLRLPGPGKLSASEVRDFIRNLRPLIAIGDDGAETVRRYLRTIDRRCTFSRDAWPIFQDLLGRFGVATKHPILIPMDKRPFWFRFGHPLLGYRSRPELPETADVVVVGAGLTGASAAYHLSHMVRERNWHIVVLDQGDPAGEASGRNGGNFELIPENSVGIYEGLAAERMAFLRRQHPRMAPEILQAVSERQASLVLGLALRNRDLLKSTILHEGINCDYSPKGWLYLASTDAEEQGICEELSLAAQHGQRIEIWSRRKIQAEFGFETDHIGRFIPGDGTLHPIKYVCGLLQSALKAGVELYARVKVEKIESQGEGSHRLRTEEGSIVARNVIFATNAFTGLLVPELRRIRPYQSQIMVTENALDRTRGRICTSERGPVFFNQPRDGADDRGAPLLMGGGDDRPMKNPYSRRRSPAIHAHLLRIRDQYFPELRGKPPSAEWVGPMGFTPDQLPCIGFLRHGVVVAAGFNGYGGSYTTAAGFAAAKMVTSGNVPEWVPEDIFSPRRLLSREPFFMSRRDSLWRIAQSLCRQLNSVNTQISDALSLRTFSGHIVPQQPTTLGRARPTGRTPTLVAPEQLISLPTFSSFGRAEVARLLSLLRCWECPAGTRLFDEGDPGGTCFILISGEVDVTLRVRGENQLLARLPAGSIFGQVSLVTGDVRNATCSVRNHAVLAEIEREPCEQLLVSRSGLALKFLAALNQGLISALRGADRRLMQINHQDRPVSLLANGGAASVVDADLRASHQHVGVVRARRVGANTLRRPRQMSAMLS